MKRVKKDLSLPTSQKTLLIWDAFKAQSTETTNSTIMDQREFSEYVMSCVSTVLTRDPAMDVTTIKLDTKLSTLKQMHAKTMGKVYKFFKTENCKKVILAGWKASGITEASKSAP